MDLKTIGLDLRPAVAEHRKFKRVPTTGRVGSRPPQTRAKSLGRGASGTVDSLAAVRTGVRHFDNSDLVRIQTG